MHTCHSSQQGFLLSSSWVLSTLGSCSFVDKVLVLLVMEMGRVKVMEMVKEKVMVKVMVKETVMGKEMVKEQGLEREQLLSKDQMEWMLVSKLVLMHHILPSSPLTQNHSCM